MTKGKMLYENKLLCGAWRHWNIKKQQYFSCAIAMNSSDDFLRLFKIKFNV